MLGSSNFFVWFILQVAQLVHYLLTAYMYIIIGRAVISWVSPDPYNPVVRFLYDVTEPVLSRIRRVLPINFGGMDFSPVIAIIGVIFLQNLLEYILGNIVR
jgi:YggT family protein